MVALLEKEIMIIVLLSQYCVIDPLLFLVIPRSPKTRSQNIATFKPFPSQIPLSLSLLSPVVVILSTRLAVKQY